MTPFLQEELRYWVQALQPVQSVASVDWVDDFGCSSEEDTDDRDVSEDKDMDHNDAQILHEDKVIKITLFHFR